MVNYEQFIPFKVYTNYLYETPDHMLRLYFSGQRCKEEKGHNRPSPIVTLISFHLPGYKCIQINTNKKIAIKSRRSCKGLPKKKQSMRTGKGMAQDFQDAFMAGAEWQRKHKPDFRK